MDNQKPGPSRPKRQCLALDRHRPLTQRELALTCMLDSEEEVFADSGSEFQLSDCEQEVSSDDEIDACENDDVVARNKETENSIPKIIDMG